MQSHAKHTRNYRSTAQLQYVNNAVPKKTKTIKFYRCKWVEHNEIKLRQNVSVILTMQLVHIYSHKGLRTRRNKKAEKAQIANTTHTNYK